MTIKIGILTYHASHNIGSMLQAYAMYKLSSSVTLTDDAEIEIINYASSGQKELYRIFKKSFRIKSVVKNFMSLIWITRLRKQQKDFERFKNLYLPLSGPEFSSIEQLESLCKRYDVIICGSDQIWNSSCPDYTNAYILPFCLKGKKIAYAPSFGGKNITQDNSAAIDFKRWLPEFSLVSAREQNGKKWLKALTNMDCPIVPDPTLAVEFATWHSLKDEGSIQSKFILFYGVPFDKRIFRFLARIRRVTGLQVIMLDARAWLYNFAFLKGIKLHHTSSPDAFLELVDRAELIVTTSFHGTIFSWLHRKRFWTMTHAESNSDDDRIASLLQQIGLPERLLSLDDCLDFDPLAPVNYAEDEVLKSKLMKQAKEYLKALHQL